jgi:type II secretory pathway predicted ATPase ExeA
MTANHQEALAGLVYSVCTRPGLTVLTGEAGTGKTTLLYALLDLLEKVGILSAFIFNPILSRNEFFECLLGEFNLKCDFASKVQALTKLNALLLERYRQGRITVLIIDEAQNLSDEILEEIRLLTNLETSTEKLLQIILVGQPELSSRLDSPRLRQLKQRISLRCSLEPLTLSETAEYIRTRLRIAGLANQAIFSDSCIAEIYRCSGGIPRLVNTICDNALATGFASDLKIIDLDDSLPLVSKLFPPFRSISKEIHFLSVGYSLSLQSFRSCANPSMAHEPRSIGSLCSRAAAPQRRDRQAP